MGRGWNKPAAAPRPSLGDVNRKLTFPDARKSLSGLVFLILCGGGTGSPPMGSRALGKRGWGRLSWARHPVEAPRLLCLPVWKQTVSRGQGGSNERRSSGKDGGSRETGGGSSGKVGRLREGSGQALRGDHPSAWHRAWP